MTEEPQTIGGMVISYWNWMKTGYAAPLKFIWTGILITEVSLLKPMALFFTAFFGFIGREIYLTILDPEYEGHWILDYI